MWWLCTTNIKKLCGGSKDFQSQKRCWGQGIFSLHILSCDRHYLCKITSLLTITLREILIKYACAAHALNQFYITVIMFILQWMDIYICIVNMQKDNAGWMLWVVKRCSSDECIFVCVGACLVECDVNIYTHILCVYASLCVYT